MKASFFALLILACILPLRADNWLQNGDFTDGINHWRGDARAPSDFTPDNPLDKPDPFTSKGLIVPLKDITWTKVAQDFQGKIASGVLTITYKLSPDLAFSTKADDYVGMPHHIGYDYWRPFNTPPGDWVVFISDFGSARGSYFTVPTKPGTGEQPPIKLEIHNLTPHEDKTITLAFPPGTGKVVILNISLTDE